MLYHVRASSKAVPVPTPAETASESTVTAGGALSILQHRGALTETGRIMTSAVLVGTLELPRAVAFEATCPRAKTSTPSPRGAGVSDVTRVGSAVFEGTLFPGETGAKPWTEETG